MTRTNEEITCTEYISLDDHSHCEIVGTGEWEIGNRRHEALVPAPDLIFSKRQYYGAITVKVFPSMARRSDEPDRRAFPSFGYPRSISFKNQP